MNATEAGAPQSHSGCPRFVSGTKLQQTPACLRLVGTARHAAQGLTSSTCGNVTALAVGSRLADIKTQTCPNLDQEDALQDSTSRRGRTDNARFPLPVWLQRHLRDAAHGRRTRQALHRQRRGLRQLAGQGVAQRPRRRGPVPACCAPVPFHRRCQNLQGHLPRPKLCGV